jgi:hypothetical protein
VNRRAPVTAVAGGALVALLMLLVLLVLLVTLAGCAGASSARQRPPAATPSPSAAPYSTLAQIAQRNDQWLDPASAFSLHAQDQLRAMGQHAGQSLTFARGYDYTNADTDGNPTTHEGYYVTLGVFAQGQPLYLAVGAVTAGGVRTPLVFALSNAAPLNTVEQDAAATYPAPPDPARIAPADLLAFLDTPGQVVGLDLTASAYAPGVLPIIGALESKQPVAGMAPFHLPAPGQSLAAAGYPSPTAVVTFPPYSTPPPTALATPAAG